MLRGLAVAAALAVSLLIAAPSRGGDRVRFGPVRAEGCGDGYSYAGVSGGKVAGIEATVSALASPVVASGHVAAWVGVDGFSGDERVWIQAGLNESDPAKGSVLYWELQAPGAKGYKYGEVAAHVPPGAKHHLSVRELPDAPGSWEALIDKERVAGPVRLPGSHGAMNGTATAENWDGCNVYRYRFEAVRVLHAARGAWTRLTVAQVFHDALDVLLERTPDGFVAASARKPVKPAARSMTAALDGAK